MKTLKKKILFLLFFTHGFIAWGRLKKQEKYLSYNFFYEMLPFFKKASIRKAIGELIKEGEVSKIIRNRRTFFRLTLLGDKRFRSLFSNFFSQQIKSKGWFFAILKRGKDARETRRQLKNLGFVKIQRAVYLLPANQDFGENLEFLVNKVLFIFTNKAAFFDERSLAGELWPIDKHYKKGQDFINQAERLLRKIRRKKRLSNKEKRAISALFSKFYILINNTIGVPKNLLPADWSMFKSIDVFSKVLRKAEG